MLDSLKSLDIFIGNCNFWLEKAEDTKDIDLFNHWFAERERLYRERVKILNIKLGVI